MRDEGLAWQLLGRTHGALGDEAAAEAAFTVAITMAKAAVQQSGDGVQEITELQRIHGGLATARSAIANRQTDDRERGARYQRAAAALADKLALLEQLGKRQPLSKTMQAELERLPGEIERLRSAADALSRGSHQAPQSR